MTTETTQAEAVRAAMEPRVKVFKEPSRDPQHRDAFLFAVRQIPERHVLAVLRAWQPCATIPRQSKRALAERHAKAPHLLNLDELRAACKERMNATKQL